MKVGDTVYVINAKTNKLDEWTFDGYMIMPNGAFCRLVKGKNFCMLPKRCVFKSKVQALKVLKKKFFN